MWHYWGLLVISTLALISIAVCTWYFLTVHWLPVPRRRMARFAYRQSRAITVASAPTVMEYLAVTRRWRRGCMLVVAVATVIGQLLIQVLGPPGIIPNGRVTLSFLALLSGWFIGAVIAEWRIAMPTSGSRRRASILPRRLLDYVPAGWLVLPGLLWVGLFAAAATGVVRYLLHPDGDLIPLLLWIAADAATAVVLVLVTRRILHRAQRSDLPEQVQIDDAIRGRSLRVMAGCALALGGYLLMGTFEAIPERSSLFQGDAAAVGELIAGLVLPILGYITATAVARPVRREPTISAAH